MLDLYFIGTGALQPLPGRALASAAVCLNGHTLLFDCGEGTQSAARAAGVSLFRIDLIALTHYHGDHIFGLPGLLQSMGIAGRVEPVFITGPGDIESELRPLMAYCRDLPFPVRLIGMADGVLPLHTLCAHWPEEASLHAFPTAHRVISRGYRFALARRGRFDPDKARALGVPVCMWKELQRGKTVSFDGGTVTPESVLGPDRRGLSLVYTGDTLPCAAIAEAAKSADILICEGTYADDSLREMAQEHGHMTFPDAARLAAEAGPRRLILTHFSPRTEEPNSFLPGAREIFANTDCAQDGLRLTLRFDDDSNILL